MIKRLLYGCFVWMCLPLNAQQVNCTFKEPILTINFGSGRVPDLNTEDPSTYTRVARYCPSDGHYAYTPYTGDCFSGDWLTLTEDHTPGDADGNMMIVNASYYGGAFLKTPILGLKGNTLYEFSVWMMNVCRPTDKCPFPLLPNISIVLQTPDGKVVFQQGLGELARGNEPHWNRYQVLFNAPATGASLMLTMIDNSPGGCGNDFALDDISFRECIKIPPPVVTPVKNTAVPPKKTAPKPVPKKETAVPKPVVNKVPATPKPLPKKDTPAVKVAPKPVPVVPAKPPVPKKDTATARPAPKKQPPAPKPAPKKELPPPVKNEPPVKEAGRPPAAILKDSTPTLRRSPIALPAPPLLLKTRSNPVIKQLEVPPGELKVDLYDNGEIDGDTITIYHNNTLIVSHARLSQKPVSFTITLDPDHPHHELVMVAENLGSIPPNTSLMVITTPNQQRYEVFISSTEQKNAKVVIDLKQ